MTQQTTIEVSKDEIAKMLTEWARDHGYDIPPEGWFMRTDHGGPAAAYRAIAVMAPCEVTPTPKCRPA